MGKRDRKRFTPDISDDFELGGNIDIPSILRYILFQMSVSKATLNYDAYGELGEFMEMLLSPYADEKYRKEMEKIKEEEEKIQKQTHPRNREQISEWRYYDFNDKRIKALIGLMARKNLLLQKEIMEEI